MNILSGRLNLICRRQLWQNYFLDTATFTCQFLLHRTYIFVFLCIDVKAKVLLFPGTCMNSNTEYLIFVVFQGIYENRRPALTRICCHSIANISFLYIQTISALCTNLSDFVSPLFCFFETFIFWISI